MGIIVELVVVLQAQVDGISLLQLENRCAGIVAELAVLVVREDVDHLLGVLVEYSTAAMRGTLRGHCVSKEIDSIHGGSEDACKAGDRQM